MTGLDEGGEQGEFGGPARQGKRGTRDASPKCLGSQEELGRLGPGPAEWLELLNRRVGRGRGPRFVQSDRLRESDIAPVLAA